MCAFQASKKGAILGVQLVGSPPIEIAHQEIVQKKREKTAIQKTAKISSCWSTKLAFTIPPMLIADIRQLNAVVSDELVLFRIVLWQRDPSYM